MALEEVMLAYRDAAQGYADAAAMTDNSERNALYSNLAEQCESMAAELKSHIRTMGGVPGEPDPDRKLVVKAIRHIKSALTNDEELALLRDLGRHEDTIARCITAALSKDLTNPTRELLLRCQLQVGADRQAIAQARIDALRKGE